MNTYLKNVKYLPDKEFYLIVLKELIEFNLGPGVDTCEHMFLYMYICVYMYFLYLFLCIKRRGLCTRMYMLLIISYMFMCFCALLRPAVTKFSSRGSQLAPGDEWCVIHGGILPVWLFYDYFMDIFFYTLLYNLIWILYPCFCGYSHLSSRGSS